MICQKCIYARHATLLALVLLLALLPACTTRPPTSALTVIPATDIHWKQDLAPLRKTVDLNIGESQEVVLADSTRATVKLISIDITKDPLRQAVRQALVSLTVDGEPITLTSATYHLPRRIGNVQIDCPAVGELNKNSGKDHPWGLDKDARIRLWPADSSWITPGTFVYPPQQRWFAGPTQMANEPSYVDGVEQPLVKQIYYHFALDFGGAEGLIDVHSATDGLVISAGTQVLEGYADPPVQPRYDGVEILDRRGWFHRYRHLLSIDPAVKVGHTIQMGAKIGVLGKEGTSGGWSHLHYQIQARQPSGKWGIEEAYAFVWQAYIAEHKPALIAVARPHVLAPAGATVELDATRSWSASGIIDKYEWTFTDGTTAAGAKVKHTYNTPGQYCEILKVTDAAGNVGYDFETVQIIDKNKPTDLPPGIQLAYAPTFGIHPGDTITFKVRSFGTTHGEERIDFGDGTPPAHAKSDGDVDPMAKNGFAILTHSFAKPGQYIVTARRTNERSQEGVTHVLVIVEPK